MPCLPITLKCLKPKEPDVEPRTLGEHLKRCRLMRKLNQKEAARLFRVTSWTVLNWEKGRSEAPIESMPAILTFLGYDPFPAPETLPERLLAKRRAMGWSMRKAARQIGVDPGTWRDWEQGGVILFHGHRNLVARLLNIPIGDLDQEMRTRWNQSHK